MTTICSCCFTSVKWYIIVYSNYLMERATPILLQSFPSNCEHQRKFVERLLSHNQMQDETAKDNHQTTAWISQDLARNNELPFPSTRTSPSVNMNI